MKFAEPLWLLGALGALGVAALLALGAFLHQRALKRFGDPERVSELLTSRAGARRALKAVLSVLALGLSFVALAQPQYGRGTRLIPATDLDVVLVMDFSKSMYARDVSPSRVERAKAEVGRLIKELPGARFGAVAFAGDAMAFPLTSDGGAIAQFYKQLTPNDMPSGGTAIARALEAGRELFARDPLSKDHRRVLVLVTDGEDLEGDPVSVANAARLDGVTIDVVQIGGRTPEPIPEVDEAGRVRGYRVDENNQPMTTSLSVAGEEQLTEVAEIGGGVVVRSEKGQTGIEQVAARLRQLMSEELSEKVETVYADVFAYPLGLAILLLLIETFIGEAPRRGGKLIVPQASERRRPRRGTGQRAARAAAAGAGSAILLGLLGSGCEQADRFFEREAPEVNRAIAALDAGDAGAATELLQQYLLTGKCEGGHIQTPEPVRTKPNASFDLGLALFRIAEQFGQRFGEDPTGNPDAGLTPEQEAQQAQRSEQAGCASTIVRQIAADQTQPVDLRAHAFYLAGNLEFLRGDYRSAVAAYDAALKLIPGFDGDAGDNVGRDAAFNRAIALRRLEDEERDASPDGGEDEPDGGDQPDGGEEPDAGDQDQEPDAGDQDQKPDAGDQDQDQKPDAGDQDQDQKPDAGEQDQDQQQPPPPQQQPKPEPRPQPQDPDESLLDQLEQAPLLQHQPPARRGRVLPSGDK